MIEPGTSVGGDQGREGRGDVRLRGLVRHAEPGEQLRDRVLVVGQQPQQQVLGADVVVAQAQCLPEHQLEHLLRGAVERDVPVGHGVRGDEVGFGGVAQDIEIDPECGQRRHRDGGPLHQEPQEQVLGADLVLAAAPRRRLGLDDRVPRPRREAGEVALTGRAFRTGHEPLLHGLFRDPHVPPDVRPRRARAPGLVDEVPDEVVGDLTEVLADGDGIAEPFERAALGVAVLHEGDEVVESYC